MRSFSIIFKCRICLMLRIQLICIRHFLIKHLKKRLYFLFIRQSLIRVVVRQYLFMRSQSIFYKRNYTNVPFIKTFVKLYFKGFQFSADKSFLDTLVGPVRRSVTPNAESDPGQDNRENQVRVFVKQLLTALQYMHHRNIVNLVFYKAISFNALGTSRSQARSYIVAGTF